MYNVVDAQAYKIVKLKGSRIGHCLNGSNEKNIG
jgi:hypothetical protein